MLRAAAGQPADELDHVGCFLSYEIVTGGPYRAAVNERNCVQPAAFCEVGNTIHGILAFGRLLAAAPRPRTVNAPSAHSPTDPSRPFTEEVPPWRSTHCRPSSA
ncbi:hypothetical protein ACFW1M_28405 [Streptomyces inhibens]|uniref:hypothetical protein n=1 Tax=Streptomyces inhibens TaxID=2293571 RepID=UPI00369B8695